MRFEARLENGESHTIEVSGKGDQLRVLIDGEAVPLSFRKVDDTHCVLNLDGRVVDAVIHRNGVDQEVLVRGKVHRLQLLDPRMQRSAHEESGDGYLAMKAPMPGRVVRILKAAGDDVEKNSAVLVIEAMKMQNDIRVPRAGVIATLAVKEGESVSAGQLLFELN